MQALACIATCTLMASAGAQTDADAANQFYRLSNEQLAGACAAMSPDTYVSGLTDGAWAAVPFTGRTYYYKSNCYMELARRTARPDLCQYVKERKTLLGDGSSHSPAACERMVASVTAARAQSQRDSERHAKAILGVFKILNGTVTALADGNWQVSVQVDGTLKGAYQFDVKGLKGNVSLATETVELPTTIPLRWTVNRARLIAGARLPDIFPIAVSLSYVWPAGSEFAPGAHLTGIHNLTVSAQ